MDVACQIYLRGKEREVERQKIEDQQVLHEEEIADNSNNVAQTVGHNMYILAYQLSRHNRELEVLMKHRMLNDEALSYYHKHTAEIEIIRHDRSIEPSKIMVFDCEENIGFSFRSFSCLSRATIV